MAKQISYLKIVGCIGGIVYYQREGGFYARQKSSLTGSRFKKDEAFAKSREASSRFAIANQSASRVYRGLAVEKRNYGIFCSLKKAAIKMVHAGLGEEEIKGRLETFFPSETNKKCN